MISRQRPYLLTALAALALIMLAGCGPLDRLSGAGGSAPPPAGSEPDSVTAADATTDTDGSESSVASTDPATGSLTLRITAPNPDISTVNAAVSCRTGRAYRAVAVGDTVTGYRLRATVTIGGFNGPGTYAALVTGSATDPDREAFLITGSSRTATVTDEGGSVPFSATGSRGRTLTGAITWTCG